MRKILLIISLLSFVFVASPVFAKDKGEKRGPNPNERAYERANENARFKREEDWKAKKERRKAKKEKKEELRKKRKEHRKEKRERLEEKLEDMKEETETQETK